MEVTSATAQNLDTSKHKPSDSDKIRKFFLIHNACNQLLESIKVIYGNSFTQEELEDMSNSDNNLDLAIIQSPAAIIGTYLNDAKSSVDFENIFEYYHFDGDNSPVHDFIQYPVISDPHLENLAFIHRSFPNMNVKLTETQKTVMCNERLEFLGDSWLGAFVAYIIYQKYPYANEGALSKMKNSIVNNNNLEKLCTKLGFKDRLKENIPKFSMKIRDKFSKYYADCVEAYIGALVVDRFSTEFKEISDWLEDLSQDQFDQLGPEMFKKPLNKNAKGELAELLQFNKVGAKIVYERLTDNPPFTVQVALGNNVLALGTGPNTREAEQRAAMEVLANQELIQKYSIYEIEANKDSAYVIEEVMDKRNLLNYPDDDYDGNSSDMLDSASGREQTDENVLLFNNKNAKQQYTDDHNTRINNLPNLKPLNINTTDNNMNKNQTNSKSVYDNLRETTVKNNTQTSPTTNDVNSSSTDVEDLTSKVMSRMSSIIGSIIADVIAEKDNINPNTPTLNKTENEPNPLAQLAKKSERSPNDNTNHNRSCLNNEKEVTNSDMHVNNPGNSKSNKHVFNIPPPPPKPSPAVNFSRSQNPTSSIPQRTAAAKEDSESRNFIKSRMPKANPVSAENYSKTASQDLYMALGKVNLFPKYKINQMESGEFHSICTVMGTGQFLGEGIGRSKKISQHVSASAALCGPELQEIIVQFY